MNVEIAIPSLIQYQKKKQGESGTETQLGSSKFHLAPTQLQSYTEFTRYYPDCRLIYLPSSCSLALLQSSNSGRDTAQASTSPRQLQPSPTRLSNRNAASAKSWKFQQAPKTRYGYFSLLRHSIRPLRSPDYFLDVPLTSAALFLFSTQLFQLTAHTPQWSDCHRNNIRVNALSCK